MVSLSERMILPARVASIFTMGFCALSMVAAESHAQTSVNTVQVAARTAAFVNPTLSGRVTAAIIYQAGDAGSEREARDIERSMTGGLRVGSMTLAPRRVASNSLEQLAGAKVAFVTRGTNYRQIAAATAARSILSISFDSACTRAGHCVVAISDGPRVQIIVSKAAANAARLRFDSSFLMLVKEI